MPTENEIYLANRKGVDRTIDFENKEFNFNGDWVAIYEYKISLQEFYERACQYFKEYHDLTPDKIFLDISGYDGYDFEAKFNTPETHAEYKLRLEKEEKARLKAEVDKQKRYNNYLELKKEFEQ